MEPLEEGAAERRVLPEAHVLVAGRSLMGAPPLIDVVVGKEAVLSEERPHLGAHDELRWDRRLLPFWQQDAVRRVGLGTRAVACKNEAIARQLTCSRTWQWHMAWSSSGKLSKQTVMHGLMDRRGRNR